MRAAALAILCCIAACGGEEKRGHVLSTASATEPPRAKDPTEHASTAAGASAKGGASEPVRTPLPGDTLALRFIDQAPQAHVDGDLAAAWRAISDHPQRSLLPYGLKSGARAYRAVQMAFSDADLESYATLDDAKAAARAPQTVRRLDPVWNRRRAVYQSRQALFVPSGASQIYRVAIPANARLETALGLLSPTQAPARFRVTVNGAVVIDELVTIPGKWIVRQVDLSRAAGPDVEVRFSVESTGGSVNGFFADPVLWASGGGAPGPNVLFILLDTLRVDATAVMPRLQQYASRAARFEQDITGAAWTRPSMLAMYGGDCPTAVGQAAEKIVPEDADRKRFYRLAPALVPRLLAARGYRVSAIGNNFFLLGYPAIGLDLGFAEVDDIRHPVKDTPAITRSAIRFLERNKDRSFFLHLHYDGTHWPYTPPDQYLGKKALAGWKGDPLLDRDPMWQRYLGEAAYTDEYVAQVLAALDRLGLSRRTLVIIVGDHGEIFDYRHDYIVDALGFRTSHHHGWSGYDELLRVPLVIGMPDTIAPAVVGQQVRSFDITPTILDYLGVTDATLPGRGRSLRPLMEGRTEPEERVAFTEGQNIRVVRGGGWAYLRREDPRLTVHGNPQRVPEELYDLRADPHQHHNLVDEDPEALARMRALFAREAPLPPDAPQIVYHLRSAPDQGTHRVQATLVTEGRVSVRGVTGAGAEAIPVDEHRLRMRLSGPGGIDFNVEPPDAPLRIEMVRDGLPVDLRRVLAGEFGLPLLDGDPALPIDADHLRRLDARHAPQLGNRGDLLLWRDPGAPEAVVRAAGGSDADEVTGMMERWGYARPPANRGESASGGTPTTGGGSGATSEAGGATAAERKAGAPSGSSASPGTQ